MLAFPQTPQELSAFINAALEEYSAASAPNMQPMPQQELADAREATARASAAMMQLQEHMSVMKKTDEVLTKHFTELEAIVQEKMDMLKGKIQTLEDEMATELKRQDDATEESIQNTQRHILGM